MKEFKFKIGDVVKHKFTDFKGTVVACTYYLHNTINYHIKPLSLNEEGLPKSEVNLEEPELVLVEESTIPDLPKMAKLMFNLGDEVKDTLSSYYGIVIGVVYYLNGCISLGIKTDELYKKKPVSAAWIDQAQLELVTKKKIKDKAKSSGGPKDIARKEY